MSAPDFVVVGHVVRDVVPGGWRLGGTVTFAAAQAHALGLRAGIVTRAGPGLDLGRELPFAEVRVAPSDVTTSFENVYSLGRRRQRVSARAAPILPGDVPADWRAAPLVLLGPVLGELDPSFAALFDDSALVGVSAQGWLRAVNAEQRVVHTAWDGEPFWRGVDVVFASDEDISEHDDVLAHWTRDVPVVAMTESWRGARVYAEGSWRRMEAFPETEVDPTGAGDIFATAFLVRLHESGDPHEAARFGAAAASISVGGEGIASVPSRAQIQERLQQYPEVALR
ncbi:MAG: PfkB family carbohydrate kinase [Dehalococcoidia bacterium]